MIFLGPVVVGEQIYLHQTAQFYCPQKTASNGITVDAATINIDARQIKIGFRLIFQIEQATGHEMKLSGNTYNASFFNVQLYVVVADGLFCREIDGLFCRSSPDIIVRRRCVLSHKRRGWLQPSPSFRYSRNLALQDELYHPVINNGPAVLVCVDKRLGTGPVNQSRDAG